MMSRQTTSRHWIRWLGRTAMTLGFAAGVVIILLYLAGRFSPKVPASTGTEAAAAAPDEGRVEAVRVISLPLYESAVGTIRAVYEIPVRSKLLARVVEVGITAGQEVHAGDVLVQLDDADLKAKLQQAKAALTSSEAVRGQAAADEQRNASLLDANAISRQEYEKAKTALRSAEAEVQRAQETVNEMQAMLDWATIRSPIAGTVVDKQVDAGEMVVPGQVLAKLFDPKRMQLVANVRESLTRQLQVGQSIGVRIEGLDKQCSGTISEIVPEAQSSSRAFQVKVTGPCPSGIYSGMFGRIAIPLGVQQVTVIPRAAVRQVGQLELVQVVQDGKRMERAIRTGRHLGDVRDEAGQVLSDQLEVLSGLRASEQIVVRTASEPSAAESPSPVGPTSAPAQEATHE
jgi:RND family efflux transporter MFP subunit